MNINPPYEIKFLVLRNYFAVQHHKFLSYENRRGIVKSNSLHVDLHCACLTKMTKSLIWMMASKAIKWA